MDEFHDEDRSVRSLVQVERLLHNIKSEFQVIEHGFYQQYWTRRQRGANRSLSSQGRSTTNYVRLAWDLYRSVTDTVGTLCRELDILATRESASGYRYLRMRQLVDEIRQILLPIRDFAFALIDFKHS